jgi:hypothetical protein
MGVARFWGSKVSEILGLNGVDGGEERLSVD